MSVEQNKENASRFVEEIFNRGNIGIMDELVAPNFVEHEELPPGIPSGREGASQLFGMLRNAFPDFKATLVHLIAEGDKVVIHMTWTGTQKGEFMGMPPSGKRMTIPVIDILRFDEGQVTEHWGLMDSMGMMQQLGATPSPQ
ncbi:MAG: ester cyclase [Anaerolineaceae bacterium]|nr:ester cyclase [Anaerolineaceae bacterium]